MDEEIKKESFTKKIFLLGPIGIDNDIISNAIEDLLDTEWKSDEYNIEKLDIIINSEGGYLQDCFALIDIVEQLKIEHNLSVTTYAVGEASSAGFFLFLLGDKRIAYPNCRMFIHEHITCSIEQTYAESKKSQIDQKVLYNMYVNYTSDRLGITKTKAKNLLKKNCWLKREEFKKFGIVTDELNSRK